MALKTARAVASAVSGIVEDPQEDTLAFPRGVKRFIKPRREERFSILELSWWYAASPFRSVEGTRRLLSILKRHVPEAVPRRYGLYEPPQNKTEETGIDHLAEFMCAKLEDSPVYYCTRPVVGFHIADCDMKEHAHLGFRSNR
ncbi:MAG: hypothetical protein GY946_11195, partial [bacterium]|nr:hypothetical protein [bacterium]